jgi:predicted nucleic acid-binding protein
LLFALQAQHVVETSDEILCRAEELEKSGFDTYDAIHLASAEQARVNVFLTTDDQILKVVGRNKKLLPFLVENPVKWLEEVLK